VWCDSFTHEAWYTYRKRAPARLHHHYSTNKWLIKSQYNWHTVCRVYSKCDVTHSHMRSGVNTASGRGHFSATITLRINVCRHYSTNKWLIVFTSLLRRHYSTHKWLVKSVFTRLFHRHYGTNTWLTKNIRMPLFCHHYSTNKQICTVIAPVCTPCVIFYYSNHEHLCTTVAPQLYHSCTTVAPQLHHSCTTVAP